MTQPVDATARSEWEGMTEAMADHRYRELLGAGLDLLDQGVTVFDGDLRMVAWNKPFLRLLEFPETLACPGVSFEEFIRFNARRGEYGPGDVDELVRERVGIARAFRAHYTERRRPNGRLLAIRGFPLPHRGFIALYSDITDLRRDREQIERHAQELEAHVQARTAELTAANAELTAAIAENRQITAALARSEARLRQITDNIPAHIAYFDHSWTYRYANRGYAEWFGWRPEEVADTPIESVIGPEVLNFVRPFVARALAGEQVTYEYSMPRSDGSHVHARSTLVPDKDAAGEVLGCFVHSVDITEQRRTFRALSQAQKMEAIGQLTGGLAHDFNNMLTVVSGNLSALREARGEDPEIAEFVAPALQAADRGAELIRRLLTFSRQQPLEPQPVDVNELVLGMSRLIRRSLPERIRVVTSALDPELVAMADANQLESALLNLALNARDAMPNGGELCIESSRVDLTPGEAEDLELEPGAFVQIAVKDTGIGMDGETLARVFEPFFTTKKFGMGSGLGMAMVYGFTRQSGGGVRIRSRQARGTTVALLLPPAPGGPSAPADPVRMREQTLERLQGRLVLLVEDDGDVRRVVRQQLTQAGCTVLEAENGQEAADMVENIEGIGLVLSDVVMPGGVDGWALARFVRRFRPELPMVLMSGFAESRPDEGVGTAWLAKPFTRDELLDALGAELGG